MNPATPLCPGDTPRSCPLFCLFQFLPLILSATIPELDGFLQVFQLELDTSTSFILCISTGCASLAVSAAEWSVFDTGRELFIYGYKNNI